MAKTEGLIHEYKNSSCTKVKVTELIGIFSSVMSINAAYDSSNNIIKLRNQDTSDFIQD